MVSKSVLNIHVFEGSWMYIPLSLYMAAPVDVIKCLDKSVLFLRGTIEPEEPKRKLNVNTAKDGVDEGFAAAVDADAAVEVVAVGATCVVAAVVVIVAMTAAAAAVGLSAAAFGFADALAIGGAFEASLDELELAAASLPAPSTAQGQSCSASDRHLR